MVRHPDTGELYVNCDPQLIQLIRETECMRKMNLSIPETARLLYFRRDTIKNLADELNVRILPPCTVILLLERLRITFTTNCGNDHVTMFILHLPLVAVFFFISFPQ